MKHGTFYLLPQNNTNIHKIYDIKKLVCNLSYKNWKTGKNILITCDDKYQATIIDNELWKFNSNTFLPHNLYKKNNNNIPIIIQWEQCCYDNKPRDLLINLMTTCMHFFSNFNEIIDFVPVKNTLKKYARKRYQIYKKLGFQLNIIDITQIK